MQIQYVSPSRSSQVAAGAAMLVLSTFGIAGQFANDGYADLLLGEGMCEMTMDNGPKMTREQVFAVVARMRWNWSLPHVVLITTAFLVIEHRSDHAMIDLGLFRRPAFAAVTIAALPAAFLVIRALLRSTLGRLLVAEPTGERNWSRH